jgi:hypothetical protein
MSSLADREAYRTGRSESQRSVSPTELLFWTVLALITAAMFAAAVAGSSYTDLLPPETFFVGP